MTVSIVIEGSDKLRVHYCNDTFQSQEIKPPLLVVFVTINKSFQKYYEMIKIVNEAFVLEGRTCRFCTMKII